jgi:hypothetical protein
MRKRTEKEANIFLGYRLNFATLSSSFLVGQSILAAAGFQPASSTPYESLGLGCGTLEAHQTKETPSSATAGAQLRRAA